MKIFVTKYALTKGIEVVEAEACGDGTMKARGSWATYFHGEGKDWHKTHEASITRAKEMRKKKIGSLKKSLAKIKNINFGA